MGYAESIALASRLHRRAAAYCGRRRGGGECAARHFPLRGALSFFRPLHAFVALVAVLVLTSCGAGNGRFRIEGRFRNLNRGEFYVYSPDGGITGRDTIQVADGRFSYNVPLSGSATFVLIFPNFSQQVVFGENGAVVKISGDASHMKEMEITGTDANELMTEFRMAANRMSPPEEKAAVAGFVAENPASPASLYLITSRLLQTTSPDYAEAARLLRLVLKEDPTNGRVALLLKQVETLRPSTVGSRLPQFAATDTEGRSVGRKALSAKVNVVNAWATWNYDSQNIQRWLRRYRKVKGSELAVVSICVDADTALCRRRLRADSIDWPNVCDGRMWATPLMNTFGLATVPGNIVADASGKIVARNLTSAQMRELLEKKLGKVETGGRRLR